MRRADRLFQIIQVLRRIRKPLTADAIAAELETSKRTIYRDIATLIGQRVPIRGEAGMGYILEKGFDLPPLMLTPDEIEAAVLGAQWVAGNADPVLAKRLQEVGTATVMPLGSPIGSNRGLETREQIRIIIEQATVPVVVDAGLGAPSHAAEALELGADAVLVNTAIAVASDPNRMAIAFKQAVEAGRTAFEIGLAARQLTASPTSPLTAFLD